MTARQHDRDGRAQWQQDIPMQRARDLAASEETEAALTGRVGDPKGCGNGRGMLDRVKAPARAAPLEDCPEAIAQWATFGEREDNWFTRNHNSDEAFAMRNSGQRERD